MLCIHAVYIMFPFVYSTLHCMIHCSLPVAIDHRHVALEMQCQSL